MHTRISMIYVGASGPIFTMVTSGNHGDDCILLQLSVVISSGPEEGAGVCVGCEGLFTGDRCDRCRDGYYIISYGPPDNSIVTCEE